MRARAGSARSARNRSALSLCRLSSSILSPCATGMTYGVSVYVCVCVSQGWLYDSNTGLPFVNSPAMREALRLWLRYMAVSVIAPVGPEGAASCAVIFSSMEVFKVSEI